VALPGEVTTERLRLVPITTERAEDLWRLHQDPAIAEWYPEEAEWSLDDARQRAASFEAGWRGPNGISKWLAYDNVDGRLIGRGGLSHWLVDGHDGLEVGWAVKGEHQRRGYATEIGRAGLDVAFRSRHAPDVIAFTEVHNRASRAVMERLGMTYLRDITWRGYIEGRPGIHDEAPFALYRITSAEASPRR
jgi:RimJ/RimL family protein N-acetyltransferase